MDILEKIKQDHEQFKSMFSKMVKKGPQAREDVETLQQLSQNITAHMEIEEETLYPALEKHDKAKKHALQAFEEHHVARNSLEELKQMSGDGDRWAAKLQVLQELVKHHIDEEESAVFKDARSEISDKQRQEWGDKWDKMKQDKIAKMPKLAKVT